MNPRSEFRVGCFVQGPITRVDGAFGRVRKLPISDSVQRRPHGFHAVLGLTKRGFVVPQFTLARVCPITAVLALLTQSLYTAVAAQTGKLTGWLVDAKISCTDFAQALHNFCFGGTENSSNRLQSLCFHFLWARSPTFESSRPDHSVIIRGGLPRLGSALRLQS